MTLTAILVFAVFVCGVVGGAGGGDLRALALQLAALCLLLSLLPPAITN